MPQPSALPDFLHELSQIADGEIRTDAYSKLLYSTDSSIYQVEPYGVFIPRSMDEVTAAVTLAKRYQVPILPRVGGSSLAGQAVNEALVIDFSRHLNKIEALNVEERWVTAQPGLVLDELNLQLREHGLQFGPDPASSNRAGIGGIVGNNSTGSHSILYGMTADHLLETDVILSDGSYAHFGPLEAHELTHLPQTDDLHSRILAGMARLIENPANRAIVDRGTPQHWRRCGGYNLDRLFDGQSNFYLPRDKRFNLAKLLCGSEGTLGVLRSAKLSLVERPKKTTLVVLGFSNQRAALEAVPHILETEPSAVELLDNLQLGLCRNAPEFQRLLDSFIEGDPFCLLTTEYYGESDNELKGKVERLKGHTGRLPGLTSFTPLYDPRLQRNVWTIRKGGLGLLMSMRGDYKPIAFIEDSAVPVEHLPEYIDRLTAFCTDLGTRLAVYAHASAGCLHVRPLIDAKVASDVAKLPQILSFALELLGDYGGALSSEHGDGRARSWANEAFFGPDLYGLFREVKQLFDPDNILNPGNVVDAPAMLENLRYGGDYQVIELQTNLSFDRELGLDRALEMCNGAGICRKRVTGTMCPSFMATREEEHSTRGRANLLRAALSGRLPEKELTSPRMHEAMSLCVSCKACKSECPSSVDMAKIKTEFLSHYHAEHGTPLRARLFSHIGWLSRLSSGPMARLANWGMGQSWMRNGLARFLEISSARSLPSFAAVPFTTWFKRRGKPAGSRQPILLFNDTFNTYNSPHIAIAATELLEAAGFEVLLPGHFCCGRPAFSKGLIETARRMADETVSKLLPFVERGIPIVGLEPSCLLTITDEYRDLLPEQREDLARIAEHVSLIEDFLAQLAEQGELKLEFKEDHHQILLHGHCHQKAMVGTQGSRTALGLPANYVVEEVDSGCCGMAGSFGYEAEHLDVSLAMAERRLLPAVRAATDETLVAAAGVSCREQIKFGTGKEALHPVEILRKALRG